MAFTSNQLLTFGDMQILIDTEDYIQKGAFSATTELVTKADITAALYLAGTDPLSSYTSTQHVRYADISPLGTGWVGDEYECVDDNPDNPPTAPTIVAGTVTSTSIEVDWGSNPGTDDNQIDYYEIQMSSDGGTNYGSTAIVQDILLGPRDYTYTGLAPSTSYKFRVRSIDNASQYSGWSNILTQSTSAAGTDITAWAYMNDGYGGGETRFSINGNVGDYITCEIQVTSGGTTGNYAKWQYTKWNASGNPTTILGGEADAPITFTWSTTTVVYCTGDDQLVFSGGAYRTGSQVGLYGWAYAQARITNSADNDTYPTGWFTININSANSGQ